MNLKFYLKIFLVASWLIRFTFPVGATTFEVPNAGSPYINLEKVKNGTIIHLPTGIEVSLDQMINAIIGSRVIYIGETHDNLEAHQTQLKIIQSLTQRYPGRIAVGMEMFRRSAQEHLDLWLKGSLLDSEFKTLFFKHWGGDFRLYQNIFEYLRTNQIPLVALKSTKEMELRFKQDNKSSTTELLPEIDENDKYHKTYSMSIFGDHGNHTPESYNPYRTLLLWEETMAQTVAEFLREESWKDWKLVVLAGGFHVQYGFGIPKRTYRRIPHAYTIILPTVTEIPPELKDRRMDVKSVPIPLYAADYAWKLAYKVLPENKIKLGVFFGKCRTRCACSPSNL